MRGNERLYLPHDEARIRMGVRPDRIAEIASDLLAKVRRPLPLSPRWWDDLAMRWATASASTRVQLFRFVDVIPMLPTSEAVADYFCIYFDRSQGSFPWPLRATAWLAGSRARRFVGRLIRGNVERMARQFVAGGSLDEIILAVRGLRADGLDFTLDVLGEATITEREADQYQAEYLTLLDRLGPECRSWPLDPVKDASRHGTSPRINLSVKASALYSRYDPIAPEASYRGVAGRLREIFRTARAHGAFIHLDMEQYAFKDLTLWIFRKLLTEPEFRDWTDVGIAMQAYLKGTRRDLRELLDWVKSRGAPVTVRIVKGAYWDFELVTAQSRRWPIPVFTQKWQSDASFDRCVTFLMENHEWLRPAVASHNLFSIAHAMAVAEVLGLDRRDYELQMLFGMGEPFFAPLVARGERLRVYAPYGKLLPGMAYLVRRLLENSSNSSFLHQTMRSGHDREALREYLSHSASAGES